MTNKQESEWVDLTGDFEERDRYLELQRKGKAVVRRLSIGWFGQLISRPQSGEPNRSKPESGNRRNTRNNNNTERQSKNE